MSARLFEDELELFCLCCLLMQDWFFVFVFVAFISLCVLVVGFVLVFLAVPVIDVDLEGTGILCSRLLFRCTTLAFAFPGS